MPFPASIRNKIFLLLFSFPLLIFGQESIVTTAPAPGWIMEFPFDTIKSPFNFDREIMHNEMQINVETEESYYRVIYRIDTYDGIFKYHTLELNPQYENLRIHKATIYRREVVLDLISNLRVEIADKSEFSGNQLYIRTADVKLHVGKVLVGDYIEIAFTRKGFSEDKRKNFYSAFGPAPKNSENANLFRLVFDPKQRDLKHKILSSQEELKINTLPKGQTEWIWALEGSKVYPSCVSCPEWYKYYPKIYVTEANSYTELLETQIVPFFMDAQPSEKILEKTIQLTSIAKDTAEKIDIILSFIQKEIGYLTNAGIVPIQPDIVLKQKFGDCKSKSLLAVKMLASLGIEAWPVMVAIDGLDFRLRKFPSLLFFDHVIIEYQYKGKNYFFDATLSDQKGTYAQKYLPNYMQGLRLKLGGDPKVHIQSENPGSKVIHDSLYVHKNKKYLNVMRSIDFYGRNADDMRIFFNKGKEDKVFSEVRTRNWWRSYNFIDFLDPEDSLFNYTFVSYQDYWDENNKENRVQVKFIKTLLRRDYPYDSKKKKKYRSKSKIIMKNLNGYLKIFPELPKGQKYVELNIPSNIEHTLSIPSTWKHPKWYEKEVALKHEHFLFSRHIRKEASQLVISYKLKANHDYIPTDSLNSYHAEIKEALNHTHLELNVVEN